jgi:hypothetical protein
MTDPEKRAYRSTLGIFALVLGLTFVVGIVGDKIGHDRTDFERAESIFEDLRTIAAEVPRFEDGAVLRQGMLSTGWLDDVGALPVRLQAMPDSLLGAKGQHALGLVKSGPWTSILILEARDSLIRATLTNVPKVVCEALGRALIKHPEQVAYVTTGGDAPMLPAALELPWFCRADFTDVTLIIMHAPAEFRRLSHDVQNAAKKMPANSTERLLMSGSSAPFQINDGKQGSSGYVENTASGIRATITGVPPALCGLALLAGPQAFGMDSFELGGGEVASLVRSRAMSDALCSALGGKLIVSRH